MHTNSSSCHSKNKTVIVRVSVPGNEIRDLHKYNNNATIK